MENQTEVTPVAASDLIKDADAASFAVDVLEASMATPVLVDFWAPWCGPCKTLTPQLEKAVTEAGGAVKLVKVNIDENKMLAQQLTQAGLPLQSIPAVFAFKGGQPVDGFVGAVPDSQIKDFIAQLTGGEANAGAQIEEALAAAAQAMEANDLGAAAQIFASVLQEEATNVAALAGLAQCYLKTGDVERAEQTLELVAPDASGDPAVVAARAALQLASQSAEAPEASEIQELRTKIEADPKDYQSRMDLAAAMVAADDNEGALTELLEIVRMDRKWNEEAARKQLVTLFEAWGPMDEKTVSGRRQLSSILFS